MRIPWFRWMLLCAVALTLLGRSVLSSEAPGLRTTVIQNVRIFDGVKVISEGAVVIKGGQIVSCGATARLMRLTGPSMTVVEGAGKTVMPGLIDAHVHVINEDYLRQALAFGVTTVVDMFMDVKAMQEVKKRQAVG